MRSIRIRALALVCATLPFASASAPAQARPATGSADAIVQFEPGVSALQRRAAVEAAGGVVVRDLPVIRALVVRLSDGIAKRLSHAPGVRAVTPDVRMRPNGDPSRDRWGTWDARTLSTEFVQSTRTDKVWTDPKFHATGEGVAVGVIDTGIAGEISDFRASESDPTSRVIASVVTNPEATTATDRYGHGTHVAGIVAGSTRALSTTDPLANRYGGTAPTSKLVSLKASDDHGNAYVSDVIAALQFVVDHGADYGIRVVNLSMGTSLALPYQLDPLDAAVEAVWAHGVVVVAAAGNRGSAPDAVSYAPANDPYVITVGAVDDHGTKDTADDSLAPWSSRGVTQDGFAKPDLVAPGAHIAAPLAPDSDFPSLCPECVVDGRYFRVSGTSMAAPVVAGIAADIISAHPDWTPDQVKGALTYNSPVLDRFGERTGNLRPTSDGAWEVAADSAIKAAKQELVANVGLIPSPLLDPASGYIDETRASWRRASWRTAIDGLRASWGAANWMCDCGDVDVQSADATTTRASWRRASWGRASWGAFFGDDPAQYGELTGGKAGSTKRPGPHGQQGATTR
jgi:serine protease AprX